MSHFHCPSVSLNRNENTTEGPILGFEESGTKQDEENDQLSESII